VTQASVERVVGKLATDEAFRRRFADDPEGSLRELPAAGIELNPCELRALAALDPELLDEFAERLDPRIQKSDLKHGCGGDQP